MKCPKCHYLGFETGDRCKHCGYDFSLLAAAPAPSDARALTLSPPITVPPPGESSVENGIDHVAALPLHLDAVAPTASLATASLATTARTAVHAPTDDLPLFTGRSLEDEPLVRFPAPPRAPLAVRKTPEIPRIRRAAVGSRREGASEEASFPELAVPVPAAAAPSRSTLSVTHEPLEASSSQARASAALLDLVLLAGVDLLVIYFTLRMAALTMGEWRLLPPVPLVLFLLMLKIAYYFAFTAIGGQTIGKMAMHIRVVSEDGPGVEPAPAFRRTVTAVASIVTLGGTFIPALVGRERRAVHDRVARTRVVALPVA